MDEYKLYASTAETVGIPYEWLTPKEIKERWALINTSDLVGAIFHPTDGYINPADVTQVMAKASRNLGVEIIRKIEATSFNYEKDLWKVSCNYMEEKGGNLVHNGEKISFSCEHLITATGNHSQATAKKLGIKIPAIADDIRFTTMATQMREAITASPNQKYVTAPTIIERKTPFKIDTATSLL